MVIYLALSVVLSELAFLAGYLLAFCTYLLLEFSLVFMLRRRFPASFRAFATGIICGCSGTFCAATVAHYFSSLAVTSGAWWYVVSLALPFYGLFSYFEKLFRQVATGHIMVSPLHGRLHAAIMVMPQRHQFYLAKALLEQANPEKVDTENDSFGQAAYEQTTKHLYSMTIFSFLGVIVGLSVAYRVFSH